MIPLIFLLTSCPIPKMINKTTYPWNDWDRNRMGYCQQKCPTEYKDAPCLKQFVKIGKRDYYCECGLK